MNIPQRSLQAITDDNERRAAAKTNLERALGGYLRTLSGPLDVDQGKLAEIWSDYALTLYDSYAESFAGMEVRWETMFGEAGALTGGEILESVKKAFTQVRVPRPEHWPRPNFARSSEDSPELLNALGDTFAADFSFAWLVDEPWVVNEITSRVQERAGEWKKSSTDPNLVDGFSDLQKSLKRVSEHDPAYKFWESFCHGNHKTEARWISSNVRRAEQGKKFDPQGAIRFVLRLFDNAVAIQLKLVMDLNSAAGCEAELRILSEGSLNYLEQLLKQTGSDEATIQGGDRTSNENSLSVSRERNYRP